MPGMRILLITHPRRTVEGCQEVLGAREVAVR